ncbi:hypothetical protein QBC44DRAFT_374232 [Cladorrhinum sp. PSN332]|nr:hypothetical protein QBC44DRAFT_374232 [Cladorrhinum sp. PSN332]
MASSSNPNPAFQAIRNAISESIRKEGKIPSDNDLFALIRTGLGKNPATDAMESYVRWSQITPQTPQQQIPILSPQDTLARLQSTTWSSLASVMDLADSTRLGRGTPLPLFKDGGEREFVVVPKAGALIIPPPPSTANPPGSGPLANSDTVHDYFLTLSSNNNSNAQLPKYVFPFGALYTRRAGATTSAELNETGYAVVIDVAGKENNVWLVWSRKVYDVEAGGVVDSDPLRKKAVFGVGVGSDKNFDAAQCVVGGLKGWKLSPGSGKEEAEGLMKKTRVDGIVIVPGLVKLEELGRVLPATGPGTGGSGAR